MKFPNIFDFLIGKGSKVEGFLGSYEHRMNFIITIIAIIWVSLILIDLIN